MIKKYRVQVERKENNKSGKVEKFVIERESNFSSCKECYFEASESLMATANFKKFEWLRIVAVLLANYAEERERVPKIKEFVNTSAYYTYIVTMICE